MTPGPLILKHRPMIVEAWQVTKDNLTDVALWCGGVVLPERGVGLYSDAGDFVHAILGAWVIKGPLGEFYPAPDRAVFASYEAVVPVVAE